MKYCLGVTVISTDSRANFGKLLADLQAYLIGRDLDPATNDFTRYVLGVGGVPATFTNPAGAQEEIGVAALIGYNPDVPNAVVNELSQLQRKAGLIQQISFSPAKTRAEAEAYLQNQARFVGDAIWLTRPGDNVTVADNAALLAKFVSVS